MSDILIKGMEMPVTCSYCPLIAYEPVGSYEEKYGLIPKGCTEVKLFKNKRDVLFALMPDGTYHDLIVDVHDTQHYGILSVGGRVTTVQAEEGE